MAKKVNLVSRFWNYLKGKKTHIVSLVVIVYAVVVVGWQGGEWQTSAEMIMAALGLSSVRHAIK